MRRVAGTRQDQGRRRSSARDRSVQAGAGDGAIPLDRILHIAEFRAGLRTFLRESERVARRNGLTPQWYQLLLAIKGAPDRSQRLRFTDIASRLQLSRNTVTELVARAEAAGLVAREPSASDQRVVYLRLTDEGDRRLCRVLVESDENRRELASAFETVADAFRQSIV